MKNILVILACLLSSLCSAQSNYKFQLDTNGLYYIAYGTGRFEFEDLVRKSPSVFLLDSYFHYGLAIAQKDNKFGYVDTLGNWTIPAVYDNASSFSDSTAIVFVDCKYGLLNTTGKLQMLDKDYSLVMPFSNGLSAVVYNNRYGAINKQGVEVIAPNYYYIDGFSYGVARYKDTIKPTNYGLIDIAGNVVLPSEYYSIKQIAAGHFIIEKEIADKRMAGVCNNKGKIIIPIKYRNIEQYNYISRDSLFLLAGLYDEKKKKLPDEVRHIVGYKKDNLYELDMYTSGGKLIYNGPNINEKDITFKLISIYVPGKGTLLINTNGDTTLIANYYLDEKLSHNKYAYTHTQTGKQAIIDTTGKILTTAIFNNTSTYGKNDNVYGNTNDSMYIFNAEMGVKTILPAGSIYEDNIYYNNGYTTFYIHQNIKKNKFILLDTTCAKLFPYEFDDIRVDTYVILFKKDNKYGLINSDFKTILPPTYAKIYTNSNIPSKYLFFKQNKKTGLLNTDGTVAIPAIYDNIKSSIMLSLNNKLNDYYVVQEGKKHGIIDTAGNTIMPIVYKSISQNQDHVILKKGNRKALYSNTLKPITGFDYTAFNAGNYFYRPSYKKHLIVNYKNKQGLIDSTGKIILPVIYKSIDVKYDYAYVQKGRKYGVVSITGQPIIAIAYKKIYQNFNYFYVKKHKQEGIFDANGKEIIPCQYADIHQLDDNLWRVEVKKGKDSKYGIINYKGKLILSPDYDYSQIDYYRNTIILTVGSQRFFYNAEGEPTNDCYIDKHIGN